MNRKKWILLAALIILLAGAGIGIRYWMNRPMGGSMALQTPIRTASEPTTTHTAVPEIEAPTDDTTPPATLAPTTTLASIEMPKICGNAGTMRLLVVGLTLPQDGERLAADAIRLVTIDFDPKNPAAGIMALPAMLWVDTPVLADLEVDESQLAAVYTLAYENLKSQSERYRAQVATQALAQTIVDNFGFVPDHYITIDETALIRSVDALGGIEVDLPEAVDGTAEGYKYYLAGKQVLDGVDTLNLARLFHPGGTQDWDVWGNQARQNLVVRSILAEMLKPENFTKLPALINESTEGAYTDLSPKQALDLVCIVEEVGDNTAILGVAEEMVTQGEARRMIPDLDAIQDLIAQMEAAN